MTSKPYSGSLSSKIYRRYFQFIRELFFMNETQFSHTNLKYSNDYWHNYNLQVRV